MDETTHGISDKVLDRAFTIEFWDVDLEAYPRWGKRDLSGEQEDEVRLLLADLMASLRSARLHFGWRVVDDVLDYTDYVMADEGAPSLAAVLDDVVYAKVLPKLRGDDSPRFQEALKQSAEILETAPSGKQRSQGQRSCPTTLNRQAVRDSGDSCSWVIRQIYTFDLYRA